jgi:molybdenum cofactor biosynthesis enzyme MoaA
MTTEVARNKRVISRECAELLPMTSALPYYYAIHLNQPCNQKCIMCRPTGGHSTEMLPLSEFLSIFDSLKGVAEHVTLIGGEPLMYPWIGEVLEQVGRHPIDVTMNTNATLLTPRITPRLLALHRLHLKVSLDAATRDTYRKIRGTDSHELVTANLERFSAAASGRANIHIILVFVVMRQNLREVVSFIDFARTLYLDRVEFHPVRHVSRWQVSNETGWFFDGRSQSCEFFRDEYNDVMNEAAARCGREGLECEITLL